MENQDFSLDCYLSRGIYSIENELVSKCYIGSTTVSFKRRWDHHRHSLRNNKHKNSYLQNAWNKYGEASFTFKVLEETSAEDSLIREQWYLDNTRDKYNINEIASGTAQMTEATIKKRAKTFKKFLNEALVYYYKVQEGSMSIESVPEKYLRTVEGRLSNEVWNKGLTKDHVDYSYLRVPKRKTAKSIKARKEVSERKRDNAENIFVYDGDFNFLREFRCASDIEEWSSSEDNDLPIKSRFKKERMGRPTKWLSRINIGKSCITKKPYKGLYFRREKIKNKQDGAK